MVRFDFFTPNQASGVKIPMCLPVCGAVEGVSDKIFSTSMTRDEQPLCGPSNYGSAFGGAITIA